MGENNGPSTEGAELREVLPAALGGLEQDIHLAASSRVPVLITGPPHDARAIARAIIGRSNPRGAPEGLLVLDAVVDGEVMVKMQENMSKPKHRIAAVLIREVQALSRAEQAAFAKLLADRQAQAPHAPRIMTSSSVSLYRCVKEGRFDARLFYALNEIHIVSAHDAA